MTMPVMEPDLDAATLKAWARVIDSGPFSSLCWGERIAFDNPECLTLLGALAAWTDRVRLVTTVMVPDCWPDTDEVRRDIAEFYGAIASADAAVGQLLDVLADTGLDANTWVLFMTDHGPALPRAMSTLYDAGTGIALIVRPPRAAGVMPRVYDELFSAGTIRSCRRPE
jgi:Sulfatase